MSIEFFVETEDEITNSGDLDEFVELSCQYGINATGANDFKTVKEFSKFFLENEDYVPRQVIKTVSFKVEEANWILNIYRIEKEFIEGVAKVERTKIDDPEAVEFWQIRGYYSQGTWNAIYGLHNLCGLAVRDNKNVYLWK